MAERVVVLTGGSSGIGRAAARMFAARGDRVVLAARGREQLERVAAECGGADVHPTDVADRASVQALVDAVLRRHGRIDVWVDSAAVMAYGRFEDLPPEVFDRVVTTDLLGTANVARAALRVFRARGGGVLVLCGSLLSQITAPYMSAYSSAKWGLRALARILRQETRDAPDIHVCLVTPGGVDTPIYTSAGNYVGRVGRPPFPVDSAERVARAVVQMADRPRGEVTVGLANATIRFGFTALPRVFDALVGPLMRRGGLSQDPIGPHEGNVFRSRPPVEGGPARYGRGALLAAALVAGGTTAAAALIRRGRAGGGHQRPGRADGGRQRRGR